MEKRKIHTLPGKKTVIFALLLAICVCFVAFDGLLGCSSLSARPTTVTIPDLLGSRFTEGVTAGTVKGDPRFLASVTYEYHPDAPARTVIAQDPPPNAQRKAPPHSAPILLRLVVSMGPHTVQLPDLTGQSLQEARLSLERLGLTVRISPVTLWGRRTHLSADQVMRISPAPGASLPHGATVTLFVASPVYESSIPCPNVTGLTLAEASHRLRDAGFTVGYVYKDALSDDSFSRIIPRLLPIDPGQSHVLWQNAIPGALLPPHTEILLTVRPQGRPLDHHPLTPF